MTYQLKNVKTKIKDFTINISNCSLTHGKIYAIVGPNGSGKTTFLNLLSFLIVPCEGEVFFSGTKVDYSDRKNLFRKRKTIAYLTQNPYLFNMSVYKNVSYGLKLRGVSQTIIHKKVEEILAIFSLSHLSQKNVYQLSCGEMQRVAIARTLILDADVFLLDEPTSNIDKSNMQQLEQLILTLNQKGATIIFTCHSQEETNHMFKNIIQIINGKVL